MKPLNQFALFTIILCVCNFSKTVVKNEIEKN